MAWTKVTPRLLQDAIGFSFRMPIDEKTGYQHLQSVSFEPQDNRQYRLRIHFAALTREGMLIDGFESISSNCALRLD